MKQLFSICFVAILMLASGCSSCSKRQGNRADLADSAENRTDAAKNDILVGVLNVGVDESIYPLVKEQEEVFLSAYPNARLNLVVKPELLVVRDLLAKEVDIVILSRELDEVENDFFAKRSIKPRVFPVWTDAIVVVGNRQQPDTTVTIEYLINAMKGESADGRKIVFDNLNSSSFRHLKELGALEKVASNFVEGQEGSEKVLEVIANDAGKIGVLGYNVYLDLISRFPDKNNIRILSVQNTLGQDADHTYYLPNQSTIAAEQYPLRQTFYVQNYQPNLGLGIGFSAFLTGDRGQRIVLKSGLVPATMPGREIIIRDDISL